MCMQDLTLGYWSREIDALKNISVEGRKCRENMIYMTLSGVYNSPFTGICGHFKNGLTFNSLFFKRKMNKDEELILD